MYSLDVVIKRFKSIIKDLPDDSIHKRYYEIIVGFMLIEHKHKEVVEKAGKPIYHYFKYHLPDGSTKCFEHLYSEYNPVRFSIETFSSIEEVREDVKKFHKK